MIESGKGYGYNKHKHQCYLRGGCFKYSNASWLYRSPWNLRGLKMKGGCCSVQGVLPKVSLWLLQGSNVMVEAKCSNKLSYSRSESLWPANTAPRLLCQKVKAGWIINAAMITVLLKKTSLEMKNSNDTKESVRLWEIALRSEGKTEKTVAGRISGLEKLVWQNSWSAVSERRCRQTKQKKE